MRQSLLAAPTCVLLALVPMACRRASTTVDESPPDATYAVRAEVVQLPGSFGGQLHLRHESIPSFRDRQGQTVGMMSMTMPFGTAADLDLSDRRVGDRLSVTFEVRWSAAGTPLRVTKIVLLPEGTRLEFDPVEEGEELPAEDLAADDGS